MTIVAKKNGFNYQENGRILGEVTYQYDSHRNLFILDHTFVDPTCRGGGLARRLVDAVVTLARQRQAKVQPACRYAAVLFRRFQADYQDVIFQVD